MVEGQNASISVNPDAVNRQGFRVEPYGSLSDETKPGVDRTTRGLDVKVSSVIGSSTQSTFASRPLDQAGLSDFDKEKIRRG